MSKQVVQLKQKDGIVSIIDKPENVIIELHNYDFGDVLTGELDRDREDKVFERNVYE